MIIPRRECIIYGIIVDPSDHINRWLDLKTARAELQFQAVAAETANQ